jgi:hypothetical protein
MAATPWIEWERFIMCQLAPLSGRARQEPQGMVVGDDVHAHRVVLDERPETGSQKPRHG